MNIIELGRGNPSSEIIPYEQISAAADRASKLHQLALWRYGTPQGYLPLREQLAERFNLPSVEGVMLGNGAMNLFGLLAGTFPQGATIFTPAPTYDFALMVLRRAGLHVVGIPADGAGLQIEALAAALRGQKPAFLYLNSDFQNPTGATLSLERREALCELARAHDLLIVEDGAYHELRYWGDDLPSLRAMMPERVAYLGTFSKTIAPGLRTGFLLAEPDLIERVSASASLAHIFPNNFSEAIIYEIVTQEAAFSEHLHNLRGIYGARLARLQASLSAHLPHTISYPQVEGGFFIGLETSAYPTVSAADFVACARAGGLAILDGRPFYPDTTAGLLVRVSFPALSDAEADAVGVRFGALFGGLG